MPRLLALLLALQLLVCAHAQTERRAVVRLEDGTELQGEVVAMDLQQLQLRTAEGVVTIPAVRIAKCSIESVPSTQPPPAGAPAPTPSPVQPPQEPAAPAQAIQEPGPAATGAREPAEIGVPDTAASHDGQEPANQPTTSEQDSPAVAAPTVGGPKPRSARPLPDEPDTTTGVPSRTYWKARLASFERTYSWVVPDGVAQWCSVGLSLFLVLALSLYSSVRLASGELVEFSRCVFLSAWFLGTGFLQVALVPGNHLAAVIVLLANPALALFWLRVLFGLSRSAAIVAFTIQVGMFALAYGMLNLLDSILASVQTPAV